MAWYFSFLLLLLVLKTLIEFVVWMYYLISWWVCYGILFTMQNVMVCIWLTIFSFLVLYVRSVILLLKNHGGIKCCVRFSVPRDLVMTLSLVWSNEKGSSSPVWNSGRELVWVLYFLAFVK